MAQGSFEILQGTPRMENVHPARHAIPVDHPYLNSTPSLFVRKPSDRTIGQSAAPGNVQEGHPPAGMLPVAGDQADQAWRQSIKMVNEASHRRLRWLANHV